MFVVSYPSLPSIPQLVNPDVDILAFFPSFGGTAFNPPLFTINSTAPSSPCPDAATCGANTTFIHLLHFLSVDSPSASYSSAAAARRAAVGRPYTGLLMSTTRQAICVDHTRPKLGVLRASDERGSSPQPVNQRCWWSRCRTGGAGGSPPSGGGGMDDDEGGRLPGGGIDLDARGLCCEMKCACCCCESRGVDEFNPGVKEDEKRSATWFATTIAILCLLARSLSKAPRRTSSALRAAILEPCEPCLSNSAR